jgi:hypothetical protein
MSVGSAVSSPLGKRTDTWEEQINRMESDTFGRGRQKRASKEKRGRIRGDPMTKKRYSEPMADDLRVKEEFGRNDQILSIELLNSANLPGLIQMLISREIAEFAPTGENKS